MGKGKAPSVTGLPGKTQRVCQLTHTSGMNSLGKRTILSPNYVHKAKQGPYPSYSALGFISSPFPNEVAA